MFMFQPDLFPTGRRSGVRRGPAERRGEGKTLAAPDVVSSIAAVSKRPRFTYMVLTLIMKAADGKGEAGPYVVEAGRRLRIRDWLADAVFAMAQRDPKRIAIVDAVRVELVARGEMPLDPAEAAQVLDEVVRERVKGSSLSSISRAVSELVQAGLVRRYYAGYRVDHENRGAQREAVYVIPDGVRRALRGAS